jgi:hypothetical protein
VELSEPDFCFRLRLSRRAVALPGPRVDEDAPVSAVSDAISRFGEVVAGRFATEGGEPEELLRGPFEELVEHLASAVGVANVVVTGEHHLPGRRVRPDYAVFAAGALVGFVELKAPGKGVDTKRYKGHDRQQWERLACLPNVLYSDGQAFALYRDGERLGDIERLVGDVTTAGKALAAADGGVLAVFENFLRWHPVPPRSPRELAHVVARLCRVLRAEVAESLGEKMTGLQDLAADWRTLLYPDATDQGFRPQFCGIQQLALVAVVQSRWAAATPPGPAAGVWQHLGWTRGSSRGVSRPM